MSALSLQASYAFASAAEDKIRILVLLAEPVIYSRHIFSVVCGRWVAAVAVAGSRGRWVAVAGSLGRGCWVAAVAVVCGRWVLLTRIEFVGLTRHFRFSNFSPLKF